MEEYELQNSSVRLLAIHSFTVIPVRQPGRPGWLPIKVQHSILPSFQPKSLGALPANRILESPIKEDLRLFNMGVGVISKYIQIHSLYQGNPKIGHADEAGKHRGWEFGFCLLHPVVEIRDG